LAGLAERTWRRANWATPSGDGVADALAIPMDAATAV
jgi:hypothetical protein